MNKGFLSFSNDISELTMLKEEPDVLSHLPLDDSQPLFVDDMLEGFIDSHSYIIPDDINSLDSNSSNNKNNHLIDPFINYRDESNDTSSSQHLLSPGAASKSPEASSLPSLCSPNSLSQEDEFAFMTMNVDDNIDLSMRAPYISMNEQDDLPLLTADDLMWGPFEDISIHKDIKDAMQRKSSVINNNNNDSIRSNNNNNLNDNSNYTIINNINCNEDNNSSGINLNINNASSSNDDCRIPTTTDACTISTTTTTTNTPTNDVLICNNFLENIMQLQNHQNQQLLLLQQQHQQQQTQNHSIDNNNHLNIKFDKDDIKDDDKFDDTSAANLSDSMDAFENYSKDYCWRDLLQLNSNDVTSGTVNQTEDIGEKQQHENMVNTAVPFTTIHVPLITIQQNNNHSKNLSINRTMTTTNINKILMTLNNDDIINADGNKLTASIIPTTATTTTAAMIRISNINNRNLLLTAATQNNKRHISSTTRTPIIESKRIKNGIDSSVSTAEVQTSPQLLQQLMAPSPQKQRNKIELVNDKWKCSGEVGTGGNGTLLIHNSNSMDTTTSNQSPKMSPPSNSVLKNLLVSGCDVPMRSSPSPQNLNKFLYAASPEPFQYGDDLPPALMAVSDSEASCDSGIDDSITVKPLTGNALYSFNKALSDAKLGKCKPLLGKRRYSQLTDKASNGRLNGPHRPSPYESKKPNNEDVPFPFLENADPFLMELCTSNYNIVGDNEYLGESDIEKVLSEFN